MGKELFLNEEPNEFDKIVMKRVEYPTLNLMISIVFWLIPSGGKHYWVHIETLDEDELPKYDMVFYPDSDNLQDSLFLLDTLERLVLRVSDNSEAEAD